MAESTRKKQDIYLLGQPLKTAILSNKLPAKGEVMRRFLYIHLSEKMTVRDNLFDIAHANAIEVIQIQENRKFLLAQREPGRRGYMSECESEEDSIGKRVQVKQSRKSFSMSWSHCAGREATAVHECLLEWNLEESVKALVFDTTASNTGKKNGACTRLQQKLRRNVLHIACPHHISEIILEHAFAACMSFNTSGPEIALFLRFRNEFNSINQADYHTIMDDESVNSKVEEHKEGIVSFCLTQLEQFQPRCDYRELLELLLILLGETPPRGARVLQPGALHRARWMARLIYAFKLYMYRHQFLLTRVEEKGICRFIVFGICVYLRS
ncbi:hypothetical protein HELRODRAFT_179046 [Helobdella robusta]|uniref:Uncharacterized protein n=1 Tax=Helobdella robusta TaxID=6412 RepID=T1FE35_HELRO|nr:hypothetical protein HELRODRAFT_179046 [Helobdella robusta]ESN95853.1 hypothetical protein HELRODRAFT_179046 [Helobdella robusta]